MVLDFLGIGKFFWGIIISLVSGIYQLVNYSYQVFLILAKTNIFEQSDYQKLTEKIYVILGVVMMFVIAYNILTFIVDPDKNKGGASVEKMLKNIVISFILIVLCPTLFNFAFKVQDAVIEQGIFSKFFDNVEGYDGNGSIAQGGRIMARYTFSAFFVPAQPSGTYTSSLDEQVISSDACGNSGKTCTVKEAKEAVTSKGTFSYFGAFAEDIVDGEIEFDWLLALIAGGYLVYVIISFCFDLAVRVVKLAFYQIIAPICIACRILPDKESIFKNWWKATSKTFLAVFIRIFIMNIGVYLISIFVGSNFFESACADQECVGAVVLVAYAFIVLGIVTFIKQAFKLLDEIFGFGDVKLGIREKFAEGGGFMAGAAIGSGVTSLARNATNAAGNIKKAWTDTKGKSFGEKLAYRSAAIGRGIGSTVSGAVTGTYRGGKAGWKAASGADMKKAATAGATATIEKRDAREAYRANHDLGPIKGTTPFVGGIATAAGHVVDTARNVGRWAGINNVDSLIAQNKQVDSILNAVDAVKDTAKDVMITDATVKNKSNTYGIDASKLFSFTVKDSTGATHTITNNYNTSEYREMDRTVKDARAAGRDTVTYKGVTFSTSELEAQMGSFAKSFSEQMANVAAKTSKDWQSYVGNAATRDFALQLDKVRSKAVDLRNVLEQNMNSEVVVNVNDANPSVIASPTNQRITSEVIKNGTLLFDGDNALGKIGDEGKIIKQRNNDKITERKAKDEGSKK